MSQAWRHKNSVTKSILLDSEAKASPYLAVALVSSKGSSEIRQFRGESKRRGVVALSSQETENVVQMES